MWLRHYIQHKAALPIRKCWYSYTELQWSLYESWYLDIYQPKCGYVGLARVCTSSDEAEPWHVIVGRLPLNMIEFKTSFEHRSSIHFECVYDWRSLIYATQAVRSQHSTLSRGVPNVIDLDACWIAVHATYLIAMRLSPKYISFRGISRRQVRYKKRKMDFICPKSCRQS